MSLTSHLATMITTMEMRRIRQPRLLQLALHSPLAMLLQLHGKGADAAALAHTFNYFQGASAAPSYNPAGSAYNGLDEQVLEEAPEGEDSGGGVGIRSSGGSRAGASSRGERGERIKVEAAAVEEVEQRISLRLEAEEAVVAQNVSQKHQALVLLSL